MLGRKGTSTASIKKTGMARFSLWQRMTRKCTSDLKVVCYLLFYRLSFGMRDIQSCFYIFGSCRNARLDNEGWSGNVSILCCQLFTSIRGFYLLVAHFVGLLLFVFLGNREVFTASAVHVAGTWPQVNLAQALLDSFKLGRRHAEVLILSEPRDVLGRLGVRLARSTGHRIGVIHRASYRPHKVIKRRRDAILFDNLSKLVL